MKKKDSKIIISAYGEDFECYSHARNMRFQLPVGDSNSQSGPVALF